MTPRGAKKLNGNGGRVLDPPPRSVSVPRNKLFSGGEFGGIFGVARAARRKRAATGLDAEALDFLIQGGEWNLEPFGRFGLIPVGALQHVHDDAAFDFFQNFKE